MCVRVERGLQIRVPEQRLGCFWRSANVTEKRSVRVPERMPRYAGLFDPIARRCELPVRPGEIGSTDYIKTEAEKLHCDVSEFELEAQFRCAGSDAFISWINNTLGIQRTPHVMWN